MKLIVNLICQNSEPELPALLKSLEGRVDGLVAIDGGSTDRTVEMLNAWGQTASIPVVCKKNAWQDDFGAQRNLCLNVTRAEYGIASPENDIWVLMIDADDTITEFDRAYLDKATASGIIGLKCKMDNGNGFFFVTQLFRLTSDATWANPIHEFIVARGTHGLPVAGTLTIKRGRSALHDRDPERNVRIGRRFVQACPQDSRARFYLARDLFECAALPVHLRYAEAEGHLRAYLALPQTFQTQDRYARLLLVRILCDGGRQTEARRLLLDSLASDPDNRSAYEALARLGDEKENAVWNRLAASAEGGCVLPYASKLPNKSPS